MCANILLANHKTPTCLSVITAYKFPLNAILFLDEICLNSRVASLENIDSNWSILQMDFITRWCGSFIHSYLATFSTVYNFFVVNTLFTCFKHTVMLFCAAFSCVFPLRHSIDIVFFYSFWMKSKYTHALGISAAEAISIIFAHYFYNNLDDVRCEEHSADGVSWALVWNGRNLSKTFRYKAIDLPRARFFRKRLQCRLESMWAGIIWKQKRI